MTVTPCPWKIARKSHGLLTEHAYFSGIDGLLLQLSQPTNDIRCLGLQIRQTGFPDLALVEQRPDLPQLNGDGVQVTLWFLVFQEFFLDELNQLASNDVQTYTNLKWEDRANNETPGSLLSLGHGKFARRMGDTHVEFDCPAIEVNLREAKHCYKAEIPIQNNSYLYVTIASRVLTTVGTPAPCLDDYPLRVKGIHGWWRLLPQIEADVPPPYSDEGP